MRVKIHGKRTLNELRNELESCLERMENIGIAYVTGANFYFTPCDEVGDEMLIERADGTTMDGWDQAEPTKRQKAKSAEIIKLAVNNDAEQMP